MKGILNSNFTSEERTVAKTSLETENARCCCISNFFFFTVNLSPWNSVDKGDFRMCEIAWDWNKEPPPTEVEPILLLYSNTTGWRNLWCSKLFPIELLIFQSLRYHCLKYKYQLTSKHKSTIISASVHTAYIYY